MINMNKLSVIIDNDALVNLTKLERSFNVFSLLRNIYRQILIPEKVKNEYEKQIGREPERKYIIQKLRPNEGFWALCTRYDLYNKTMLFKNKGIDDGEAEIVSQAEKLSINNVISDDNPFKKACNELNINLRINNTIFLLAVLDIHGFVADYIQLFSNLHKIRPFNHEDLINEYKAAANFIGVKHNPAKISKNTYYQIISFEKNEF